jgi:hypothetical protein
MDWKTEGLKYKGTGLLMEWKTQRDLKTERLEDWGTGRHWNGRQRCRKMGQDRQAGRQRGRATGQGDRKPGRKRGSNRVMGSYRGIKTKAKNINIVVTCTPDVG